MSLTLGESLADVNAATVKPVEGTGEAAAARFVNMTGRWVSVLDDADSLIDEVAPWEHSTVLIAVRTRRFKLSPATTGPAPAPRSGVAPSLQGFYVELYTDKNAERLAIPHRYAEPF